MDYLDWYPNVLSGRSDFRPELAAIRLMAIVLHSVLPRTTIGDSYCAGPGGTAPVYCTRLSRLACSRVLRIVHRDHVNELAVLCSIQEGRGKAEGVYRCLPVGL